jgi:hypothetical protein
MMRGLNCSRTALQVSHNFSVKRLWWNWLWSNLLCDMWATWTWNCFWSIGSLLASCQNSTVSHPSYYYEFCWNLEHQTQKLSISWTVPWKIDSGFEHIVQVLVLWILQVKLAFLVFVYAFPSTSSVSTRYVFYSLHPAMTVYKNSILATFALQIPLTIHSLFSIELQHFRWKCWSMMRC